MIDIDYSTIIDTTLFTCASMFFIDQAYKFCKEIKEIDYSRAVTDTIEAVRGLANSLENQVGGSD